MLILWEIAIDDASGVRFCLGVDTPVEMRCGKRKSITAVDTAEVIDARFDDMMRNLRRHGIEEKRYRTNLDINMPSQGLHTEPEFVEVEMGDNVEPKFCW